MNVYLRNKLCCSVIDGHIKPWLDCHEMVQHVRLSGRLMVRLLQLLLSLSEDEAEVVLPP